MSYEFFSGGTWVCGHADSRAFLECASSGNGAVYSIPTRYLSKAHADFSSAVTVEYVYIAVKVHSEHKAALRWY